MQPPEPTYNLTIMDELGDTKALSCLQIETIVYACQVSHLVFIFVEVYIYALHLLTIFVLLWQRHLHHLPNGPRAGFFIGDGAGVGKGRTIAGLIWENWQQGRHKAL